MSDTNTLINTNCRTIGFVRDDFTLQVLATINNNDELLSNHEFGWLEYNIIKCLEAKFPGEVIISLKKQNSPDYVEVAEIPIHIPVISKAILKSYLS